MRVYNTLNSRKEELSTLNPHEVKMYVCGPTTYNYIHLGNARPLVVFDTVRRYLAFRGYKVNYVQNFTDVDDKIINRAREEGDDPLLLAQRYIKEYFQDADTLGIRRADIHPRVSEHIPDIVAAVQTLAEKGYAYEMEGDVYFRVQAFKDYGKLSGRSLEDMLAGARVEVDERKENAADFALWKAARAGEPAWDSPWGKGRPGWHIECSVMSTKYLGNTLDIHGGGSDLIFPHHENEIAQAESLTGQPFVKYWMHNGFITVNNEKMSKSLGNFFILRDILAQYPADVVRFYLIATHYRSPLDFDDGKLEEARKALGRLKTTLLLAAEFLNDGGLDELELTGKARDLAEAVNNYRDEFIAAMDDDFNTAKAIASVFEISHTINSFLAAAKRGDAGDRAAIGQAVAVYKELGDVLGIFMDQANNEEAALEGILQTLVWLRKEARAAKDFTLADNIRDFLKNLGISLEDGEHGSRLRYEQSPQADDLMAYLLALRQTFKAGKDYARADALRDKLKEQGIILEDSREGARWKFADA